MPENIYNSPTEQLPQPSKPLFSRRRPSRKFLGHQGLKLTKKVGSACLFSLIIIGLLKAAFPGLHHQPTSQDITSQFLEHHGGSAWFEAGNYLCLRTDFDRDFICSYAKCPQLYQGLTRDTEINGLPDLVTESLEHVEVGINPELDTRPTLDIEHTTKPSV